MSFPFVFQAVMDSVSGHPKTEAGLLGESASFSHPVFTAVGHCFRRLCFSPPEFIPWQRASGSVGPLTHPLMPQLVKTRGEAPYQSPGRRRTRRRTAAPCARTESLIEPLAAAHGIRCTSNKEHCRPVCCDGAGCDEASPCDWLWEWQLESWVEVGQGTHQQSRGSRCEARLCLPEPSGVQPRTGMMPLLMLNSGLASLAPGRFPR